MCRWVVIYPPWTPSSSSIKWGFTTFLEGDQKDSRGQHVSLEQGGFLHMWLFTVFRLFTPVSSLRSPWFPTSLGAGSVGAQEEKAYTKVRNGQACPQGLQEGKAGQALST